MPLVAYSHADLCEAGESKCDGHCAAGTGRVDTGIETHNETRMRCENCRRSFKPARADQRFCSARCRLRAHRAGQPAADPEPITTPVVIPDHEPPASAPVATASPVVMTDWQLAEDMRGRADHTAAVLKQHELDEKRRRKELGIPAPAPAPAWVSDCGVV